VRIPCGGETFYIEAHHMRPLGKHDGPDNRRNMLVLCPNHHAMFDLGLPRFISPSVIEIGRERIELTCKHAIAQRNIDYYMAWICRTDKTGQV
jgi:hypothetical protein